MNWIEVIAMFFSGLSAGFINMYAGGGAVIPISVLLFFGFSETAAIGTNKLALMFGAASATGRFIQNSIIKPADIVSYLPAISIGTIAGAFISNSIPEIAIKITLMVVLTTVILLVFIKPDFKGTAIKNPVFMHIAFLIVGIYGGAVQAGMGFFIITALRMTGKSDLKYIVAVKLAAALVITSLSLIVFAANDNVYLVHGLIIGAGCVAGAELGNRLMIKNGEKIIKPVLAVALAFSAVKMFL